MDKSQRVFCHALTDRLPSKYLQAIAGSCARFHFLSSLSKLGGLDRLTCFIFSMSISALTAKLRFTVVSLLARDSNQNVKGLFGPSP